MAAPLHAEAAASSTLRSKPTAQPHGEIAVDSVAARIHANGDSVTRGTARIMVSMRLGSPKVTSIGLADTFTPQS